jgi:hypothetical protein
MSTTKPLYALLAVLLIALGLTGCGARPTASPAAVANQTPDQSALREAVLAAFRAQRDQPYRTQSTTVTKDGAGGSTLVEYVPPDRYHIAGDNGTELIVAGQQVYLKQGEEWAPADIPADSLIDPDTLTRLEDSISDLQDLGSDTLDGVAMQVCQYQSKIKVGDDEPLAQTKLWIGAADGLPYKMVMDGQVASFDASTGQVTGVEATTTLTYTYDATLQIEVP